MLEKRGTPLLRQMTLTSHFARVCRSKNAPLENIVRILGCLTRHCNLQHSDGFRSGDVAMIMAVEFSSIYSSFFLSFIISILQDLGSCKDQSVPVQNCFQEGFLAII